ncbi:hypothetical protein [Microbacterium sp. gxy059]|uniref:hypothetical protein n=1 Tax=Microbacterium sp. gxy059 TaxID=2957199 RepID=UPI003D97D0C6
MDASDWIPHRRASDGELVGWIRPAGDGFVALSLFAAPLTGEVDWLDAEETLDAEGLSWLAEPWILERDGRGIRVRIVEVSPGDPPGTGRVQVKTDDFGAIDVPYELIDLPWPPPAALRPIRDDERGIIL